MSLRTFSALIVTRNPIFREGLARILPQDRFQVVRKTASLNGSDLCDAEELSPDLILLGAMYADSAEVDDIAALHWQWPSARIVVLSDRHSRSEIAAAFRAGASAWVEQPSSHDALINIIDLVLSGETILISPQLNQLLKTDVSASQPGTPNVGGYPQGAVSSHENLTMPDPSIVNFNAKSNVPLLSDRERLIAAMLVSGYSNKLIARQIDVSEATVKVHIKSILRKIRVSNRTQAAIWATRNGIVALEDRARTSATGLCLAVAQPSSAAS